MNKESMKAEIKKSIPVFLLSLFKSYDGIHFT
jgi:hypothetical protein